MCVWGGESILGYAKVGTFAHVCGCTRGVRKRGGESRGKRKKDKNEKLTESWAFGGLCVVNKKNREKEKKEYARPLKGAHTPFFLFLSRESAFSHVSSY